MFHDSPGGCGSARSSIRLMLARAGGPGLGKGEQRRGLRGRNWVCRINRPVLRPGRRSTIRTRGEQLVARTADSSIVTPSKPLRQHADSKRSDETWRLQLVTLAMRARFAGSSMAGSPHYAPRTSTGGRRAAQRTAGYAADVVVFDVINPMQHVGLDGLRKRLEKWFSTFTSPIDCEMRDLSIAAGNDVAWCHFLNRFSESTRAGGALDMWVRFTVCLRKIDGHWMVTHEHASVPFDVETGRASVHLAP